MYFAAAGASPVGERARRGTSAASGTGVTRSPAGHDLRPRRSRLTPGTVSLLVRGLFDEWRGVGLTLVMNRSGVRFPVPAPQLTVLSRDHRNRGTRALLRVLDPLEPSIALGEPLLYLSQASVNVSAQVPDRVQDRSLRRRDARAHFVGELGHLSMGGREVIRHACAELSCQRPKVVVCHGGAIVPQGPRGRDDHPQGGGEACTTTSRAPAGTADAHRPAFRYAVTPEPVESS